jgi:hypothetical protein
MNDTIIVTADFQTRELNAFETINIEACRDLKKEYIATIKQTNIIDRSKMEV